MNDIQFVEGTNIPLKKNELPYFQGDEQYWLISSGKEKDLYGLFFYSENDRNSLG